MEGKKRSKRPLRDITISSSSTGAKVESLNLVERLTKEVELGNLVLEFYAKAPHLTEQQLYDYALEQAFKLTESTVGFFHILSADRKSIVFTVWKSFGEEGCSTSTKLHSLIEKDELWADCVRTKNPTLVSNLPLQKEFLEGHISIERALCVPVFESDRVSSLFVVGNKDGEYVEQNIKHLQLVANELQRTIQQRQIQEARQLSKPEGWDWDDTQRGRVEEDLEKSKVLFRSVITTMAEGVSIQAVNSEIISMNPAAERILARTAQQMLGRTSHDQEWGAIYEDGSPCPGEMHPAVVTLRTGKPQSNVILGVHQPNGNLVWLSVNCRPLCAPGDTKPYAVVTTFRDISDQKRAEETLKKQFSTLRGILDSTDSLICSLDVNYRYTSINRALAAQIKHSFGQDVEIGDNVLDYLSSTAEFDRTKEYIDRALAGERLMEMEFPNEKKTAERHFLISFCPIKTDDEKIIGIAIFAQNVTERKKAEEALVKSETKYRSLLQNIQTAIVVHGPDTKIITSNVLAQDLLGVSAEQMLGKTVLDPAWNFLLEDGTAMPLEKHPINQVFSTRRMLRNYIVGLRRPNNTRDIWVLVNADPVFDENGEISQVIAAFIDVTERKRTEMELKRLTHAIEQSPVSVIMTNAAGDIEYVNPRFTETTGYALDEVRGKNPRFLQSGETGREQYQQLWQNITSGKAWRGEFRNKKKNGELFWESVSISPVHDKNGAVVNYISVREDITERKRAEQELRQNEIRRRDLEQQLLQAQKLESLGTLASGIAHDFNNILGIILGYVTLIEGELSDSPEAVRYLKAVQVATTRGSSLVRQLLTFARKGESVFSAVSINHLVKEVIDLLQETMQKLIVIDTNFETQIPSIVADATQIHQVLLNLCVNARDAMPNGGRLSITTSTVTNEFVENLFPYAVAGKYVEIKVSDTGDGMDSETRKRIFDPFFTTKGPGKGTGLGLALVHSIVESHRGFIKVDSSPGSGTTFSLYFPAEEGLHEMKPSASDLLVDIPGGTETILVIEDEETLRNMLRTILLNKGYNVLTAGDGEEGLELYARYQKHIAVVFSDFGLPKTAGYEVFERIKSMDRHARIILASGFMEPTTKAELLEKGLMQFIQKPYSPSDVLLSIRSAIDQTP